MSSLGDFTKAAFAAARTIAGADSLAIAGGTAVSVTSGTRGDSRGFEAGGYEQEIELEVTAAKAEFEAAYTAGTRTYLGKTATLGGRSFRISDIRYRDPLYVIQLISTERGA